MSFWAFPRGDAWRLYEPRVGHRSEQLLCFAARAVRLRGTEVSAQLSAAVWAPRCPAGAAAGRRCRADVTQPPSRRRDAGCACVGAPVHDRCGPARIIDSAERHSRKAELGRGPKTTHLGPRGSRNPPRRKTRSGARGEGRKRRSSGQWGLPAIPPNKNAKRSSG